MINYFLCEGYWFNKADLKKDFFAYFYQFLKGKEIDLTEYDIKNEEDFLIYCQTWTKNGRSDLYNVGDKFKFYYLVEMENGSLEDQKNSEFIGYCVEHNKFIALFQHLIEFFAYWRTDEGYATKENHGTDFFYKSWDALVDTMKFFYFSGESLKDKYPWFQSDRVKEALDNIPRVLNIKKPNTMDPLILDGYTFLGWYKEAECINLVDEEYLSQDNISVYAKIE